MTALAETKSLGKSEATTCVDYNNPQGVQPTHYWDGRIHLVPMFDETGKAFKGFVIVNIPKGSPFLDRSFQVGDILTGLDDTKAVISSPGEKENKFLIKLKENSFKSAKIERCQKIVINY